MEELSASNELIPAAVLIPLLIGEPPRAAETAPQRQQQQLMRLKTRAGLVTLPETTEVILTVRTLTVEHHKGQIAFPGGCYEADDSSLEKTALRESLEEIGLDPRLVEVVAELPDVPTVATRFKVRPYVGLIKQCPQLQANPHEIGEILYVPLRHLLDPAHSKMETFERGNLRVQMRSYFFESHRIWGATGLMLQTFLEKFITT